MSIKELAGAAQAGAKLRKCIGEAIENNLTQLTEGLATLGKDATPEALLRASRELRVAVADLFKATPAAADKLQGDLLKQVTRELRDPDTDVVR